MISSFFKKLAIYLYAFSSALRSGIEFFFKGVGTVTQKLQFFKSFRELVNLDLLYNFRSFELNSLLKSFLFSMS